MAYRTFLDNKDNTLAKNDGKDISLSKRDIADLANANLLFQIELPKIIEENKRLRKEIEDLKKQIK